MKTGNMEKMRSYPGLDLKQSGILLRYRMNMSGLSVREIQDYLVRSCPQPVYRWLRGKALPSVDHLYALSRLFGVHMEELLADGGENPVCGEIFLEKQYLLSYLGKFRKAV